MEGCFSAPKAPHQGQFTRVMRRAHTVLQYSIEALNPHQAGHPRGMSEAECQENNLF